MSSFPVLILQQPGKNKFGARRSISVMYHNSESSAPLGHNLMSVAQSILSFFLYSTP